MVGRVEIAHRVNAVLAVSLVLGLYGFKAHSQRAQVAATEEWADAVARDKPVFVCHISTLDTMPLKCPPKTRTLLWGDSMAWSWLGAFPDASDVTMDSCAPFLGAMLPIPAAEQCRRHNAIVATLPADTVVLAARWTGYPDLYQLAPTLDALAHVPRVVIIGPTPEMRELVPRCIRLGADCAVPRAEFDATARPILAKLREIAARHPNATVVDPTDKFCTATECPAVLKGVALYWDDHHFTRAAGRLLRF